MRKKIIGIILLVLIIFGGYSFLLMFLPIMLIQKVFIFPMMILRNIRVIILMYMLMIISRILQVQRLKMNAI